MHAAGKTEVPIRLLMAMRPSSSGWRSASSASRENSGNSSKNKTPRWARLTSPGLSDRAAPHQGGARRGVMGGPERPLPDQSRLGTLQPGDTPHPSDVHGLFTCERREYPRQPPCQHGLARPGRPDHQQVVPPGGDYLQSPFRLVMTGHFGQIERFPIGGARGEHRAPTASVAPAR